MISDVFLELAFALADSHLLLGAETAYVGLDEARIVDGRRDRITLIEGLDHGTVYHRQSIGSGEFLLNAFFHELRELALGVVDIRHDEELLEFIIESVDYLCRQVAARDQQHLLAALDISHVQQSVLDPSAPSAGYDYAVSLDVLAVCVGLDGLDGIEF